MRYAKTVLLAALCLVGAGPALCARGYPPITNGLYVTFDLGGGERFGAPVSDPLSVAYARRFVRGEAPSRLPANFLLADGRRCPKRARIARVRECRDARCTMLRGIYGGRAPAL